MVGPTNAWVGFRCEVRLVSSATRQASNRLGSHERFQLCRQGRSAISTSARQPRSRSDHMARRPGTRCNGVRTNQTAHSVLLPGTREVIHFWPRNSHPSRLRHKRPNGGRKIRTLSQTASSKPKLRANSAREPWRESPAIGPAKPERRQRSQSGWRKMT